MTRKRSSSTPAETATPKVPSVNPFAHEVSTSPSSSSSHNSEFTMEEARNFFVSDHPDHPLETSSANVCTQPATVATHPLETSSANVCTQPATADTQLVAECGPHQDCCGGFYNYVSKEWTDCRKRISGHVRGQVCISSHRLYQCSTCTKVLHSQCWLQQANGTCMQPQTGVPFQCFDCHSKAVCTHSKVAQDAECDVVEEEKDPQKVPFDARFNVNRNELMKLMQSHNWNVRSSFPKRIYWVCAVSASCKSEVKAHWIHDEQWGIYGLHTAHSCGCSVKAAKFTGMQT